MHSLTMCTEFIFKLSFFIPVPVPLHHPLPIILFFLLFCFYICGTAHTYIMNYIRTESKLIQKICVKTSSSSSFFSFFLILLFFGSVSQPAMMIEREKYDTSSWCCYTRRVSILSSTQS